MGRCRSALAGARLRDPRAVAASTTVARLLHQGFPWPADFSGVKVSGFTFDAVLHDGASTLVYAGVRDSDGLAVVGKVLGSGQRDVTREYLLLQKVAGPGIVETLGLLDGGERPVLVQRR